MEVSLKILKIYKSTKENKVGRIEILKNILSKSPSLEVIEKNRFFQSKEEVKTSCEIRRTITTNHKHTYI